MDVIGIFVVGIQDSLDLTAIVFVNASPASRRMGNTQTS